MTDFPPPGSGPPPPPPPPPPSPYGVPAPAPPGYQAYQPYQTYGHQQHYGGERAGFWARFAGTLLDGLIGIVAYIPGVILLIVSVAAGHDDVCYRRGSGSREAGYYSCRQPNGALFALGLVVLVAGVVGYYIYLSVRLGRTGQTIGRKAAGVKVVDKYTGQPIGVGKAIGRYLFANFISGQVCYLGYLWMLWDSDKQTWHDKVVNSIVVRA